MQGGAIGTKKRPLSNIKTQLKSLFSYDMMVSKQQTERFYIGITREITGIEKA
jgi:hypothetical protein